MVFLICIEELKGMQHQSMSANIFQTNINRARYIIMLHFRVLLYIAGNFRRD